MENIENNENNIKIIFKAIEAKDLKAGDLNGFSDPYLKISYSQEGVVDLPPKLNRTKRINETLTPKWNESFVIELNPLKCSKLKIEVYDFDFIGKDDFLGSGFIPLDWIKSSGDIIYEEWIPLSYEKMNKKAKETETTQKGSVHIKIRVLGFINEDQDKPFKLYDELPPYIIKSFKTHKNGDTFQTNSSVIIPNSEILVDLGWDNSKKEILEYESSVVAYNFQLKEIDCAYYFNLLALNGTIKNLGDKVFGDKQKIKIYLDKIPKEVNYLAVILHSENKNSLDKAKNIYIRISNKKEKIGKFILAKSEECFRMLLGIFQKDPLLNNWYFSIMAEPIKTELFNIAKGKIQRLICKYSLNGELNSFSFESDKEAHPFLGEETFKTDKWIKLKSGVIYTGLGFIINTMDDIAIDTSIFSFDDKNNLIEILNYDKPKNAKGSIILYDVENKDKIPQAKSDDDLLSIDFSRLDSHISTILVTINCGEEQNLINIYDVFIRLFDKYGPIGIHAISEFTDDNGIIMGQFKKNKETWYFEPLNVPFETYYEKDSLIEDLLICINEHPLKID